MKKFLISLISVVAALSSLLLLLPTFAAHPNSSTHAIAGHPHTIFALEHQYGKVIKGAITNTSTFTCSGAVKGNQIINVIEVVTNDADSGQAGNYWAFDNFTRSIQVWNTGPDTYCAVVKFSQATFQGIAGQQSPGSTSTTGGILTGDEHGTFRGGYEAAITGQLDVSDAGNWPLRGNVLPNPVNYQCDSSGNCPGFIDWTTRYFNTSDSSFTFNENPWGWTYVAADKNDGVWTNASTGNSGDILDRD